ncbi:MAG: ATP-dependent metallopeptidase FtsH/Yme1/Tma family protein [bacterium]|nr:ATP-dependent metallopeptidase FtsH/Yme1/Tma family protein [bacterium]
MNQKNPKGLMFWAAFIIIMILLWSMLAEISSNREQKLAFTDFMQKVATGDIIKDAYVDANVVTGTMVDNGKLMKYRTAIPLDYPDVYTALINKGVETKVEELNKNEWLSLLLSMAPFVIIGVFWIMMMRQQGGGKAFSFGKSRARMFTGEKEKVTFKDVAGIDEATDELQEIIEFLKEPRKFQRLGGRIPRGVLLIGPPGTGKTLLARAIAGEAKVPFFSISGSDFVELFVGVGASRVRDLFEEGKKHSPCLIFIDEIDAVGRQRGSGLGGGHDEREQTLNALLVEMDGFDPNVGIIIIAAPNRPDILDTALLRPGRFDRRITVPNPDVKGREDILKVHTRKIPLSKGVDLKVLARSTPGFTGADLANLINEAALYASRKGKKKIDMKDFEYAKDKVLMGVERKSMLISETEKEITAYHEAGHALLASLEKDADPLHKVSIIPRGMALGITQQLPMADKYSYSKDYLDAQLRVLLAGRLCEEIFLDTVTTGAGNDFEKVASIARQMVCDWGMSSLGPLQFGQTNDMVFMGKEMAHNNYSEETARKIDHEIKTLVDHAYEHSKKVILENREACENIAKMLLERETLTSNEINDLIAGKTLAPLENGNNDKKKRKRKADDAENTEEISEDDDDDYSDDTDTENDDDTDDMTNESGA